MYAEVCPDTYKLISLRSMNKIQTIKFELTLLSLNERAANLVSNVDTQEEAKIDNSLIYLPVIINTNF